MKCKREARPSSFYIGQGPGDNVEKWRGSPTSKVGSRGVFGAALHQRTSLSCPLGPSWTWYSLYDGSCVVWATYAWPGLLHGVSPSCLRTSAVNGMGAAADVRTGYELASLGQRLRWSVSLLPAFPDLFKQPTSLQPQD